MNFFLYIGKIIKFLAYVSGLSMLLMMLITVIDVVMRLFDVGLIGAYDMVKTCGAIAIACGLPYLTAVKGHIAIEFFYHRAGKSGRLIMDTLLRIFSIFLFSLIAYYSFKHGISLLNKGEVFPNFKLPIFWIPIMISFSCLMMVVIFVYHLIHPGREYIKP